MSRSDLLELDKSWFQPSEASPAPASTVEKNGLGTLDSMEKEHILKVLRHTKGNYGEACKILGISRPTLRRKMNEHGLKE